MPAAASRGCSLPSLQGQCSVPAMLQLRDSPPARLRCQGKLSHKACFGLALVASSGTAWLCCGLSSRAGSSHSAAPGSVMDAGGASGVCESGPHWAGWSCSPTPPCSHMGQGFLWRGGHWDGGSTQICVYQDMQGPISSPRVDVQAPAPSCPAPLAAVSLDCTGDTISSEVRASSSPVLAFGEKHWEPTHPGWMERLPGGWQCRIRAPTSVMWRPRARWRGEVPQPQPKSRPTAHFHARWICLHPTRISTRHRPALASDTQVCLAWRLCLLSGSPLGAVEAS